LKNRNAPFGCRVPILAASLFLRQGGKAQPSTRHGPSVCTAGCPILAASLFLRQGWESTTLNQTWLRQSVPPGAPSWRAQFAVRVGDHDGQTIRCHRERNRAKRGGVERSAVACSAPHRAFQDSLALRCRRKPRQPQTPRNLKRCPRRRAGAGIDRNPRLRHGKRFKNPLGTQLIKQHH
jgi:hypothetical protein